MLAAAPAVAQEAPGAGTAPAVAADEIARLVELLESPERRDRLLADLKALRTAEEAMAGGDSAEGASALRAVSGAIAAAGERMLALVQDIGRLPESGPWIAEQWGASERRGQWLTALGNLATIVAGGIAAGVLAFFALRGVRRRFERLTPPSRWLRPIFLLGYHLLRLVPHLVLAGVSYGVLWALELGETVRLVALAIINAHLMASVVKALGNQAIAPYTPQFRLTPFRDETAFYCVIWWRRLVNITVYGYFFCQAVLLLGIPESGYAALMRLLGLLVVGLLIVLILQNRAPFARWLRVAGRASRGRVGLRLFTAVARFGDYWHIPAILYVIAGGLLAAAEGLEGFLFLAKSTASTVAIAWATGFAITGIRAAIARGFRIRAAVAARHPGLQTRVNRYLSVVGAVLQGVVMLLGASLALEAWNVDIFTWLASDAGRAAIGVIASIAAIVAIAAVILEVATTLVDRYLSAVDETGELVERSRRARTLLPLARNALRVVVGTVAVLMVLSELGIDIAPVLAGVGVVGLAIGFGAQTLVKDIITGLFILLEDSVAVGDVVTAAGHTGKVEALTIRTIRLRDLSGNVHTVPFGDVGSVTNMTKEFSRYVLDVGVAYRENYDEVVAVMREVGEALQQDPAFGPNMLEPLEIMGLDSFGDSAVVIRARLTTVPLKQWETAREYNRLLKAAFDARGIEIPFPHTTLYFGEDKEGRAPAAHLTVSRARGEEAGPAGGSSGSG